MAPVLVIEVPPLERVYLETFRLAQAAHHDAGIATTAWSMFDIPASSDPTDPLFGQQQIQVGGYGSTPTLLDQKYWSSGVSLAKLLGRHAPKFGWDFQRTIVDGTESTNIWKQLFGAVPDYQTYGINDAGVYLLQAPAPLTAQNSHIRIRNNYNGLYFQDDIKVFKTLTANAGLRWDRDSRFPTNGNLLPRLGFAWALALKHTFLIAGIVELPWKFQFSSIFRVQSGFPYSRGTNSLIDVDGDYATNGIDHAYGRNEFTAPALTNMDVRMAMRFDLSERSKLHAYFEMFNLFNTDSPAAVEELPGITPPFGSKTQVLPGREGQIGLRIEF